MKLRIYRLTFITFFLICITQAFAEDGIVKDQNYQNPTPDTSIYCSEPSLKAYACAQAIKLNKNIAISAYVTAPINPQQANLAIKRLIINIHGIEANNQVAFAAMAVKHDPDTEIVAPFFGSEKNNKMPPKVEDNSLPLAIWASGSWSGGKLSEATATGHRIGSFKAIEGITEAALKSFPNLQEIIIAGFSAGGQTTQRYAAFSGNLVDRLNLINSNIKLKFVVASPSSYLYFDPIRITKNSNCESSDNCNLTKSSFALPDAGSICSEYNTYKYGLNNIPDNLIREYNYNQNDLMQNFLKSRIDYLLNTGDASQDTKNYSGTIIKPTASCAAELEGPIANSYRLQRGLTFYNYLKFYHSQALEQQRLIIFDGKTIDCEHNEYCVWGSVDARKLLGYSETQIN